MRNKSKKPVGGVPQLKIGLKKSSCNFFFFIKGTFWAKTHKYKKNGSKSEKYKFTNIFRRFFQRGKFLIKGFQQNSMNYKVKVSFCLEMVVILLKNENNLISIFPLQRPHSALLSHPVWLKNEKLQDYTLALLEMKTPS